MRSLKVRPRLPGYLKIRPAGLDRDKVKCPACHARLYLLLGSSRPSAHRYLFTCQKPGCPQRGKRKWIEVRDGKMTPLRPGQLLREAVGARGPRRKVPFDRACTNCGATRIATRWESKTIGACFRATCKHCKISEIYDLRGERANPKGGRTLNLGYRRPVCRCGRNKVIGGRYRLKSLGPVTYFICPDCPRSVSQELWTDKGGKSRRVSLEERKAAESQSHQKSLPFDRGSVRCPKCNHRMRYRGRLRRGRSKGLKNQPHHFFCPSHRREYIFLDDRGRRVEVTLGGPRGKEKEFPWGARPTCPECQTLLKSNGEWQDSDNRHLYRLECRDHRCSARRFYFDAHGTLVSRPRRIHRRIPVDGLVAGTARKAICRACLERPVWKDSPRVRYCAECQELGSIQAWRQQQKRMFGPYAIVIRTAISQEGGLRRLRARFGLTQRILARNAGLSLPLVKKLEQRSAPITKKSRMALLRAFSAASRAKNREAA